ncbi:hypothetical protein FHP25_29060 [Vineibacter terrae]|uniref:Uncharacterized protein n=1 Tax=Vineibacter terrae TaxID=2586908 RepID=A0A5C8PD60_9HYPH|nr:hypothetical protein [Vineibacter terrae]TXL71738.1 hypothetical protein FHP25_29060 [Vineibacter terrae]
MERLFDAKAKLSVTINGLLVPFSQAPYSCTRFTQPFIFYNGGSPFDVSLAGSCALVREAGENYLIATRHQLGKRSDERERTEVCVAFPSEERPGTTGLVTPCGSVLVSYDQPEMQYAEDLLILMFTRGEKRPEFNLRFLDINRVSTLDEAKAGEIVSYFITAFPSVGSKYNLTEDGMALAEVISGFARLTLEPSEANVMDGHIAFHVKENVPKERNLDGYSGAPVFFVWLDASKNAHLGFAGIVRLGGNNILHVYDGDRIRRIIQGSRRSASTSR